MIRDWDSWPFIVAEGAGGLSLATYRIERNIVAVQRAIGLELYPTIRALARLGQSLRSP